MKSHTYKYDLILLDSGYEYESTKWNSKVDVYEKTKEGNWEICNNSTDEIGHGTAVLSIVLNGFDGNYAVFKAFTSMTMSNLENVLSALNYIYNNLECKYIQMSFGVRGYNKELEEICEKLYKDKGIIIIAAFDNCGAISFPAAFRFVIGVSGDPYIKTKDQFVVNHSDGVLDIYAKSGMQVVAQKSKKGFYAEQGNSFAASYVTLSLLQASKSFNSKEEALLLFDPNYRSKNSIRGSKIIHTKTKAAAFPLNKEMYSLINYADMLKLDLVSIYDVKYSGNLNRELVNFKGDRKYIVKNIEKCCWDEFDTLIIGHVRELSLLLNRNIKKELLDACIAHGKNAYCFDNLEIDSYRDIFAEHNLILECPDDYTISYKQGKLYQIKTPVLAVLGTGKKQGKFTLQMQIKRIMEKHGINLGIIGTEPNSLLLGCDEVLPLGYDSKISNMPGKYIIEAFNEKMHNIDVMEKDLILVGGQSGFFPHVTFNIGHININQIAFLYGILPDGVILSINDTDSIEYIKKSIACIESLCNTKVFLLALYAYHTEYDYVIDTSKRPLSNEEISRIKKEIYDAIGLKVVVSGDLNEDDEIFKSIIEYYCETDNDAV